MKKLSRKFNNKTLQVVTAISLVILGLMYVFGYPPISENIYDTVFLIGYALFFYLMGKEDGVLAYRINLRTLRDYRIGIVMSKVHLHEYASIERTLGHRNTNAVHSIYSQQLKKFCNENSRDAIRAYTHNLKSMQSSARKRVHTK